MLDPGQRVTEGETSQPSVGRLRWRTRRGIRELDLILQRYLADDYPGAPAVEQRAFAQLLEQPDADLLDWLLGRSEPPADLAHVIAKLRTGR